ncbi:MAG: hypothetical protein ACP5UV_01755 [Thermoplasmata archaeon]
MSASNTFFMFVVYSYKKENEKYVNEMLAEDRISRLTVVKRDGNAYGIDGSIIMLEGGNDIIASLKDIESDKIVRLDDKKSKEIYEKIKKENESAEGGMGFIFG